MTDISSISSKELSERRRQLRRQRRLRFLQTAWQVLSMAGLTASVVWLVSLPDWMLRDPGQIVIEGNKSLAPDMIRAMVPINYPQSVLALQPEVIARQLETESPIADATVSRRLFPPGIVIRIQERYPVATVYNTSNSLVSLSSKNFDNLFPIALVDAQGTWIPYEKFASLNQSQKLPSLKVIGMQQQYQPQWVSLYEAVSRSPIKISVIDWREPSNLILRTEIGMVHLGPFSSRFPQQLKALDQMRKLPEKIDKAEIDYIDLSNPDMPMVEMVSGKEPIKPSENPPSR